MSNVSKFNKWKFVQEARKPRKCPIIDFTPIRDSELYSDVISLGWVEVNAQGHPRIEPAMELGKTDLNTFSSLVNKYGVEKVARANKVEELYQDQKKDAAQDEQFIA
jgi:hypothetical protein